MKKIPCMLAMLILVCTSTASSTAEAKSASNDWPVVRAISKAMAVTKETCRKYRDASPIYNTCTDQRVANCRRLERRLGYCHGDFVLLGEINRKPRTAYCASGIYLRWDGKFMRVVKPRPVFRCIPV